MIIVFASINSHLSVWCRTLKAIRVSNHMS